MLVERHYRLEGIINNGDEKVKVFREKKFFLARQRDMD